MLALRPVSTIDALERIDELLEARYRCADLGNLEDVLAETVFILLSKQTRGAVYEPLFGDLRRRFPTWVRVRQARLSTIERVLRPGGFHRQRAVQLRQLLNEVDAANRERRVGPHADVPGDLTLEFLHDLPDREAERFLLSLTGIGPKSARCVMAYALGRSAFAVDTHVHRIISRLALVPSEGRKADHDPFQDAVPGPMRKRLHMNLVHHGREICRTRNERCSECILVSWCRRGRERLQDSRPAALDLFAGAGGLGLGFRQAGFRISLAIEADRNAAQTYRFNHPGTPVVEARIGPRTRAADIRKWLPKDTGITAIIAGPPCQGYSMGGRRRPEAASNDLYRHVARLARQLEPEFVVLENVPGLKSVSGHGFLLPIQMALESAGYHVKPHLLRASDFGVPQRRLRYFFLCRRRRKKTRGAPDAPRPTHQRIGQLAGNSTLPTTPTVLEVLADIPVLEAGVVAEPYYVDLDGNDFLNMSTMRHSQRVIEKIARIAPGKGPLSYRRLEYDEAQTLVSGHRAMPVHPAVNRTISVREAALLQGFPLDYRFLGTRAHQPLQVVNAVPPPLAAAVARQMLAS